MNRSSRRSAVCAAAFLSLFAPNAAHAQNIDIDGSMGNYYQNMYLQTHMAMAFSGRGGGSTRTLRVRRVHASPTWTTTPSQSAAIKRMVAAAPQASRAQARVQLPKMLAQYPLLVQAVNKQSGIHFRSNDARDTATIAGILAYQGLSGKELTNGQITAERSATNRWFASHDLTRAQMQESAEKYALAICLMAQLKQWEANPQNKNPDGTKGQYQQLLVDVFKTAYQDADYTKFAPTNKGIVKVR